MKKLNNILNKIKIILINMLNNIKIANLRKLIKLLQKNKISHQW